MVVSDWSSCPQCKMVANFTDLKRILEHEPTCPMCESNVPPMSIKISDDPQAEFKSLINLMKDSTGNQEEENNGDMDSEDEALLQ